MPTYEYACRSCGQHVEVAQAFTDPPLTTCTNCGGELRKVFGNVGIVLKGSGFYKTDSRSATGKKGSAPKQIGDASSSDGGSSNGSSAGESSTPSTATSSSGSESKSGSHSKSGSESKSGADSKSGSHSKSGSESKSGASTGASSS
jgi:putative FmdB family regulatory protein